MTVAPTIVSGLSIVAPEKYVQPLRSSVAPAAAASISACSEDPHGRSLERALLVGLDVGVTDGSRTRHRTRDRGERADGDDRGDGEHGRSEASPHVACPPSFVVRVGPRL